VSSGLVGIIKEAINGRAFTFMDSELRHWLFYTKANNAAAASELPRLPFKDIQFRLTRTG
jgi:hypothetical protein